MYKNNLFFLLIIYSISVLGQPKFNFPLDTASRKKINCSNEKGKQGVWKKRESSYEIKISYYKDDCLIEEKEYYFGFLFSRDYLNQAKDTVLHMQNYYFSRRLAYKEIYPIKDTLKRMKGCFRAVGEVFPYDLEIVESYKKGLLVQKFFEKIDLSEFPNNDYKYKYIKYFYKKRKLSYIVIQYCGEDFFYKNKAIKEVRLEGDDMKKYLEK